MGRVVGSFVSCFGFEGVDEPFFPPGDGDGDGDVRMVFFLFSRLSCRCVGECVCGTVGLPGPGLTVKRLCVTKQPFVCERLFVQRSHC